MKARFLIPAVIAAFAFPAVVSAESITFDGLSFSEGTDLSLAANSISLLGGSLALRLRSAGHGRHRLSA
jgi:hypothetical protein